MSVQELIADIRADKAREVESRIYRLTKALAHLGCSCTQKTRETDIEAHEVFCRFRQAMQDMS